MSQASIIISGNVVAICVNVEGKMHGFIIKFATTTSSEDRIKYVHKHIGEIIERYSPNVFFIRKVDPKKAADNLIMGSVATLILESGIECKIIDMRDVYKKLELPLSKFALLRKFGKRKLYISTFLYDKEITKQDYSKVVEALAILEVHQEL